MTYWDFMVIFHDLMGFNGDFMGFIGCEKLAELIYIVHN